MSIASKKAQLAYRPTYKMVDTGITGLPAGIQFGGGPTAPATMAQGGTPGLTTQKEYTPEQQKQVASDVAAYQTVEEVSKLPVIGQIAGFSAGALNGLNKLGNELQRVGEKLGIQNIPYYQKQKQEYSQAQSAINDITKGLMEKQPGAATAGSLASYMIPVVQYASPAANIMGGINDKSISRVVGGIAEALLLKGGSELIGDIGEKAGYKVIQKYLPQYSESEIVNFVNKVITQQAPIGAAFNLAGYIGGDPNPTLEGAWEATKSGAIFGAALGGVTMGISRAMGGRITPPEGTRTIGSLAEERMTEKPITVGEKAKQITEDKAIERIATSESDAQIAYDLKQLKAKDVKVEDVKGKPISEVKDIVKGVKPTEEPQTEITSKTSGVAKSIEAKAIEKGIIDKGYDELAGYDSSTIKEQSKLAEKYSTDDHIKFATGEKPLPKELKPATALSIAEDIAMKNKDGELALKLANSPLATEISESASTLSLSRMREPDSATAKINEVKRQRKAQAEKKGSVKKDTSNIKNEIKKTHTKETWTSFIESIKCK